MMERKAERVTDAVEPIGLDPDVTLAVAALERAMDAAANRAGHKLQTVALLWATEKHGDGYGGSLIKGDVSEDTIDFLANILTDDSEDDQPVPDVVRH